jgi:hypothetical protein
VRASEILRIALVVLLACDPGGGLEATQPSAVIGGGADPDPTLTFTQVAKPVGIDRSNEPPSAGAFTSSDTLAYGGWLADLDGDGRLDYFGVNHGQWPHLSGLFVNNGAGGFGKNLFTVSFQLSDDSSGSPTSCGSSATSPVMGGWTFTSPAGADRGSCASIKASPRTPTGPVRASCASGRRMAWRSPMSMAMERSMS